LGGVASKLAAPCVAGSAYRPRARPVQNQTN
jgi:hypothetical protein